MTSPYTRSITICSGKTGGSPVLLDEALGGCLDPDEGFFGRHVAHLLGGEQLDEAQLDEGQLDEAQGGEHGFCGRLDKLLAALLPAHAQRARLECGTVL